MTDGPQKSSQTKDQKSPDAFRTISEVADELGLAAHVLRFWESKFSQVRPLKRGGKRRYYRPSDVELLKALQALLHGEGYTIRGVQHLIKEQGIKQTIAQALGHEPVGTVLTEDQAFPKRAHAKSAGQSAADPEHGPGVSPTASGSANDNSPGDRLEDAPAVKDKPQAKKSPAALKGLLSELKSLRAELSE